MPRARLYRNNAEKQAAYRARHADRQPPRQALLARLGQELHGRLRLAVEAGTNQVPATLLGKHADDTLINQIGYVSGAQPHNPREEGGHGDAAGTTASNPPDRRPPV
jgi:hypothetical protein